MDCPAIRHVSRKLDTWPCSKIKKEPAKSKAVSSNRNQGLTCRRKLSYCHRTVRACAYLSAYHTFRRANSDAATD